MAGRGCRHCFRFLRRRVQTCSPARLLVARACLLTATAALEATDDFYLGDERRTITVAEKHHF